MSEPLFVFTTGHRGASPGVLVVTEMPDGSLGVGTRAIGGRAGAGVELTEERVEELGHTLLRWCELRRASRALYTAQERGVGLLPW